MTDDLPFKIERVSDAHDEVLGYGSERDGSAMVARGIGRADLELIR